MAGWLNSIWAIRMNAPPVRMFFRRCYRMQVYWQRKSMRRPDHVASTQAYLSCIHLEAFFRLCMTLVEGLQLEPGHVDHHLACHVHGRP